MNSFEHVPKTAGGHFVIYLFAGIFRLINQIRRLHEVGGPPLEEVFERYPFLAGYFDEMRRFMPDDITWGDGPSWWALQIEKWESDCFCHLPLRALAREARHDFPRRLAVMVTGLVEEDSRFGTLYRDLQSPLEERRPTLELIGQMMIDDALVEEVDPWKICRSLVVQGLLEPIDREVPRSEWLLRVPPILWDAIRGDVSAQPASWCRFYSPDSFPPQDDLIFPEGFLQRVNRLPGLIDSGRTQAVILRAGEGANPVELLGAVAASLQRGVIDLAGSALKEPLVLRQLGPLCTLTHSMPVIRYELGPGDTVNPPELKGYSGPLGLITGHEGGFSGPLIERSITLSLPDPQSDLRRRHWLRALGETPLEQPDEVVKNFHLDGAFIRKAARIAQAQALLDDRPSVGLQDVRKACRVLNRQLLDSLASRLNGGGSWDDLVASESTAGKLCELERRCRHREELLNHLGPAFGNSSNRGVRALFTGASGTGKTMAARILAAELGMDLYRVDLASVINKYIGETEKNLHRVLSRAEALDVILLLDEGDALLGQRTEVKSANDRYANLETNYLLQRLENYQGIVVVTTNLGENIDPAFQRRMDVVVPFFPPQAEERWRILTLHLPVNHRIDAQFLEKVSLRCVLTGGQLRNAALLASLLALEEGSVVSNRHLREALRSEHRKAGATFPLAERGDPTRPGNRMESFVSALTKH